MINAVINAVLCHVQAIDSVLWQRYINIRLSQLNRDGQTQFKKKQIVLLSISKYYCLYGYFVPV